MKEKWPEAIDKYTDLHGAGSRTAEGGDCWLPRITAKTRTEARSRVFRLYFEVLRHLIVDMVGVTPDAM